jgi:hypothetical protein
MTGRERARQASRILADGAMLAAVAAIGLALALQGWRNVAPAIDMVSYFRGAEDLVLHGILPTHGDVSSYGSFSPPGAAWLMAPGMLVFDDPRLFEKLGSAVLHVLTLVGIYLLGREAFGRGTALLAVGIYGLSGLALAFAGSLWPIGHPVFAVWVTLLAVRWVSRRDGRFLVASALTLAVGLYDTLRIAPLGFVLPALWLAYRPPVPIRGLALAGMAALILWLPYLGLQLERGFADLRSQLTLQNIVPANYRDTWCDPQLIIGTIGQPEPGPRDDPGNLPPVSPTPVEPSDPALDAVVGRARTALLGLLAPFSASAPWTPFAALLAAMCLISFAVTAVDLPRIRGIRRRVGMGLAGDEPQPDPAAGPTNQHARAVLLLATAVPWLILLLVAEPGATVRFLWLWSLLAIWAAAFVTHVLGPRIRAEGVWLAALVVPVALVINPIQGHLDSWLADGWEGADPAEVVVADALAAEIRTDGRTSAAIGYRTYIYEFMASYNIIDADYRVGTEFDTLLHFRNGISNTNVCPEGVSSGDEYRIVQIEPLPGADVPRSYFDVPVTIGFHTIAAFPRYQLLERD